MKVTRINASIVRSLILPRRKDSHKGDYGHVLIVAGSKDMPGAAVLCAGGALRAGAGLVTLAVCADLRQYVLKRLRPEVMLLTLKESAGGTVSSKSAAEILNYIKNRRVSVVAIGPGLGGNSDVSRLVKKLIKNAGVPVVLDADGLNAVTKRDIENSGADIIVTPHPGEMSRLTGFSKGEIQRSRESITLKFASSTGTVCVLKGSGTVISDGRRVFVNTTGNPGMAKGGSGDVLSGIIAALTGQVRQPAALNAALAGVYLHGLAGDIAAKRKTIPGMLPGDITDALCAAIKKVI